MTGICFVKREALDERVARVACTETQFETKRDEHGGPVAHERLVRSTVAAARASCTVTGVGFRGCGGGVRAQEVKTVRALSQLKLCYATPMLIEYVRKVSTTNKETRVVTSSVAPQFSRRVVTRKCVSRNVLRLVRVSHHPTVRESIGELLLLLLLW